MGSPTLSRLLTLVSAPLIWFGHFVVCYAIVALACASPLREQRILGLHAAQFGVALATLIAGALILLITVLRWRRWRHQSGPDAEISRFFAVNTLLLCAISLMAMLWVAFPTFILPPCAS
ncbi:hypothetical protein KY495_05460 [Massilia sp. PAMC28688]|uniref:hypothetical protein n=1 Tax=Massilia sp. PAMC28688 TaxID=2861283 RepID=UPI001C63B4E9|nr:hypothetical protein [Massilia sp. PAMC28688]QYF94644.1 hypothetical protein KY495_05460 [Massilia sp. PAMC28688]